MGKGLVGVLLAATIVAGTADAKNDNGVIPLKMKESGCFQADFSAFPEITFYNVGESLALKPFGETSLDWEVTVLQTETGFQFVDGGFAFALPGGDTLSGDYTGFSLDPATGDYTLDWAFTGGSGELEGANGSGRTDGNADLTTLCADFKFKGKIRLDD